MTKLETTSKIQRLRLHKTDEEVAKIIGISRQTLYTRIAKHNWKISEIFMVEKLKL